MRRIWRLSSRQGREMRGASEKHLAMASLGQLGHHLPAGVSTSSARVGSAGMSIASLRGADVSDVPCRRACGGVVAGAATTEKSASYRVRK